MKKVMVIVAFIYVLLTSLANAESEFTLKGAISESETIYQDEDWRYFVDVEKGLVRISPDGSTMEVIDSGVSNSTLLYNMSKAVWKIGNFLYYQANGFIVKSTLDGSQKEKLVKVNTSSMCLYENRLYFVNYSDHSKIYYFNISNKKIFKVSNVQEVRSLAGIVKGYIYYDKQQENGLFRMKTDGTMAKRLTNVQRKDSFYNLKDSSWVYFSDFEGLKALNLNSLKIYIIRGIPAPGNFHTYNIIKTDDKWVYYIDDEIQSILGEHDAKAFEKYVMSLHKASLDGLSDVLLETKN
ncbi:MAG: DUF5050 domain-containing protein [Clostridia bacterium]|nr:DUF5050 domain-containing protein [Clostridia bacterium]